MPYWHEIVVKPELKKRSISFRWPQKCTACFVKPLFWHFVSSIWKWHTEVWKCCTLQLWWALSYCNPTESHGGERSSRIKSNRRHWTGVANTITWTMNMRQGNWSSVSFFDTVQREVRDQSVRKVRGWLEDKEAGGSVCTSRGQHPEGVMGWECLERLQGQRDILFSLFANWNVLCGKKQYIYSLENVSTAAHGTFYICGCCFIDSSHQSCVAIRWCNIAKCIFLFLNESTQYGQYSPILVNITFYGFFNIQDAYLLVRLMETHLAHSFCDISTEEIDWTCACLFTYLI